MWEECWSTDWLPAEKRRRGRLSQKGNERHNGEHTQTDNRTLGSMKKCAVVFLEDVNSEPIMGAIG